MIIMITTNNGNNDTNDIDSSNNNNNNASDNDNEPREPRRQGFSSSHEPSTQALGPLALDDDQRAAGHAESRGEFLRGLVVREAETFYV